MGGVRSCSDKGRWRKRGVEVAAGSGVEGVSTPMATRVCCWPCHAVIKVSVFGFGLRALSNKV